MVLHIILAHIFNVQYNFLDQFVQVHHLILLINLFLLNIQKPLYYYFLINFIKYSYNYKFNHHLHV